MRAPRIVLGLVALAFAGLGVAFIASPIPMAALTDIVLPTATAQIDFVATYGGFSLGFAAFLALCQWRREWTRLGLLASGMALAGFGLTRAAGLALADGPVRAIMFPVLLLELVGTALSFWAASRAGGRPT